MILNFGVFFLLGLLLCFYTNGFVDIVTVIPIPDVTVTVDDTPNVAFLQHNRVSYFNHDYSTTCYKCIILINKNS